MREESCTLKRSYVYKYVSCSITDIPTEKLNNVLDAHDKEISHQRF